MKNCRNPLRFVKYVFCVLLVSSAVLLLKTALVFQDKETGDKVFYGPERLSDDYTRQMVRDDFYRCITQPLKTFCVEPQQSTTSRDHVVLATVDGDINNNNESRQAKDRRTKNPHPVYDSFMAFTRLCKQLEIQPVLIEPSVVFCLLNEDSQKLLMKRRFNISAWTGAENVLTFSIDESESAKLSNLAGMKVFLLTDFNYWSTEMEETEDNELNVTYHQRRSLKTHHFFILHRTVIHVVVFYRRHNYFWHGGISMLPNEVLNVTPMENLLFAKREEIYERFLPVEIFTGPVLESLYIPSDPRLFLHQIESSQFLRCNSSNGAYLNQTKHNNHEAQKKFAQRASIAVQEMKVQLYPELMTFWIMGGTLLGWYRQCGIIPYTTDVDFGAWATDLDDHEKMYRKFLKNKRLKLREIFGLPKEALEYRFSSQGLMVDLFFCYDDGEHYWVSGHRPSKGYYFPYYYPKFTLCSADLLGHKVQVPCDTLSVLLSDYGTEWTKPISNWNYETSPKNKGKTRYWYEPEKPLIYKKYF